MFCRTSGVYVSVSLQLIFQETLHFCYIWHDRSSGEFSFDDVEKACFPRSGLLRPLQFQVLNWSKVIRRWDYLDLKFVFAFDCQVIRNFTKAYDWMPILASNGVTWILWDRFLRANHLENIAMFIWPCMIIWKYSSSPRICLPSFATS